ncbi:MAG: hypothetical protein KJ025_06170 [Burkholderiales bacterium]|nr:hypothetical protein [Burkholderiales bacterium]
MTTKTKRARGYGEGDILALPLPDGGYAIGIIARASRQAGKGVLLGYFFGSRRASIPSIDQVASATANDAVHVCRFGDLGLIDGTWSIVGRLPEWRKEAWPNPAFVREQLVSGRLLRVVYADDDPSRVVSETEADAHAVASLPRDGLLGAQAVASVLGQKLPKLH